MKFSAASKISSIAFVSSAHAAFVSQHFTHTQRPTFAIKGYLDDLSEDLYADSATPNVEEDRRENNQMNKAEVDRFGPGNLNEFVEFNEFDGGDGQMGVAGDGTKGLDKSDFTTAQLASTVAQSMDKSKARSAKNAWGSTTGYADQLVKEKNMDVARAQQLENWQNQQEIRLKNQQQKFMTEQFDALEANAEADWRTLAKFGVERNEEFDMNEAFGEVTASEDIEATIELHCAPGGVDIHEFSLKNPYMGFADFRAAFSAESSIGYSVTPSEGALQKNPTEFIVKFRPESIGQFLGYLVIETEDFKKTWKFIGSTA